MPDQAPQPASERVVRCAHLGRDLPGLAAPPLPNELGKRVFAQISAEAWRLWLEHSKILVNEHGLRLSDPEARAFLLRECEAFLFGAGASAPVAPKLVQLGRGGPRPGSPPPGDKSGPQP